MNYNIEKDHFFIKLPRDTMPFMYNPYDTAWTECVIKPYDFDGYRYKVIVKSVEPGFVSQTFYRLDFDTSVGDSILVKDSEHSKVEHIEWNEHLYGDCFVHHCADIVT